MSQGRASRRNSDAAASAAVGTDSWDGVHQVDLCQPALAAAITRDAERRCSQQRERTSQAIKTALEEVSKATRAVETETVRNLLRGLQNHEERAWTPHTRKEQHPRCRKAKVGRATGLANTPPWAQEFNDRKRRVSWVAATESIIDEEPPPFPAGAPLEPPPLPPPRRGTIVSAVLAAAAAMATEHPSSPNSMSSKEKGGGEGGSVNPGVLDDDWVVRKLAQIRRRSRSIDSAIGDIPGIRMRGSPTTLQHLAKSSGEQTTQEAPHETTSSTASAPTGTTVVIDDTTKEGSRVTPLEQQGGMATLQPLPYPSRTDFGRLHISSHNGEQGPPHPSPLLLQPEQMVALLPFAASTEEVLHEPDATRHPPRDDQGEEDQQQQQEDRQLLLQNLTPEEEALSLPNSSLLAADGSGDLGELELHERSVRWRGPECAAVGVEGGDGGGRGARDGGDGNAADAGRETVWSRRRKKKEADEASAKKEAEVAKEKRARMVLEVLAHSKHIFRCNAARRRRNSSDHALGGRGLNGTSSADDIGKGMRARTGTLQSTADGRPRTSPFPYGRTTIAASAASGNPGTDTKRSTLSINDDIDNGDNTSGEKNDRESSAEACNTSKKSSGGQDLAVYTRTAKPSSSLPVLPTNSESGGATADQDPAVNMSGERKYHTTGTAPAATNTGAAAERRDSGVSLAAKRVAMKRHREKAEEKKQAQEKTTKLEAKRAFEASLRGFVTKPHLPPATANGTRSSGVATKRRASAPEWSCISSGRGSGASSGPRYRETAPEESSNRGMCVRVRVPVAARETTQATAISGAMAAPPRRDGKDLYDAQINESDDVDSMKQEVSKARSPPGKSVEISKPTRPVGSVNADTHRPEQATEQRQDSIHRRWQRRRQCREAREEEKRTAGLLEELCKRGQDAMTSIDASLCHDSSERPHSNWEREVDDELELGTLGEISTRDARPRTSKMLTSKHHSAVRTAAVTLGEQGGVGDCGGRTDGSSVAKTRQKRRRGSSVHLRDVQRPEGKQIGVGGAERLGIAAVLHDPVGVRRKSQSPPRTYFRLAEEPTSEGGKRSILPQRQHRGLPERKKRRRRRQKYRRHQQHQQHQHRLGRSEPLPSEEGRDGDGHDDSEANATSTPEKDLGRTETPGATWRSGIIAKAEAKVNADNGEHQTTRTPPEETAQQKLPGNTQQKGAALDRESRKATFKPPMDTRVDRGPTVGTYQGSLDSRRGRNVSVDLGAAPKTLVYVGQRRANGVDAEAKVMGRAPAASPEGREQGLEAGAGPRGGHDEDREQGFESRSSATGESRFRRNRRRKSQQRIAGETSLKPGRREPSSGEIRHPQVLQRAAEIGEGTAPNADTDDAGGDNVHKIETPVTIKAGDGTILRTGKDDSLLTDDGGVGAGIGGSSGGGGGGGNGDGGGDGDDRQDGRSEAWLTVGVEVARKQFETRGEDDGETSSTETLYDTLQRVGNEIEGLGVSRGEAGSRNAGDTLREVVEGAGERWNPGGSQNSVDVDHPEPYDRFSANGAGAEQEGWVQDENSESVAGCLQQRGGSEQRQGTCHARVGNSEVLSSAEKLCCILEERGQESEEG